MRMYGEAPYIDYVVHAGDNMDFKKESVHAMVEKIVADAQTAYSMVPNKYVKNSENFGRVDKGACLGLIAFVRWVAATPLWNLSLIHILSLSIWVNRLSVMMK